MSQDIETNDGHRFPDQTYRHDEQLQPTIEVERDILPIAIQHGMELWWDGSTPTKRLDTRDGSSQFTRFVNARIEGKLGEVAFMQFLEDAFGCRSQVDWRIYGEYTETDDGDLQHILGPDNEEIPLGTDMDIKKTKPWNSWLAIREEIFTRISDEAPIILAKLRIESDLQLDPWDDAGSWDDVDSDGEFRTRLLEFADTEFPVDVELVGAVYKDEFNEYFEKGQHLYDPQTGRQLGEPLKRPNHGLHVRHIDASAERWNRVVADICANAPPETWRPLPVTGK